MSYNNRFVVKEVKPKMASPAAKATHPDPVVIKKKRGAPVVIPIKRGFTSSLQLLKPKMAPPAPAAQATHPAPVPAYPADIIVNNEDPEIIIIDDVDDDSRGAAAWEARMKSALQFHDQSAAGAQEVKPKMVKVEAPTGRRVRPDSPFSLMKSALQADPDVNSPAGPAGKNARRAQEAEKCGFGGSKGHKRRQRCKICPGCVRPECGRCKMCKDMPKFGGTGRTKKSCEKKICLRPILPKCPCFL